MHSYFISCNKRLETILASVRSWGNVGIEAGLGWTFLSAVGPTHRIFNGHLRALSRVRAASVWRRSLAFF